MKKNGIIFGLSMLMAYATTSTIFGAIQTKPDIANADGETGRIKLTATNNCISDESLKETTFTSNTGGWTTGYADYSQMTGTWTVGGSHLLSGVSGDTESILWVNLNVHGVNRVGCGLSGIAFIGYVEYLSGDSMGYGSLVGSYQMGSWGVSKSDEIVSVKLRVRCEPNKEYYIDYLYVDYNVADCQALTETN